MTIPGASTPVPSKHCQVTATYEIKVPFSTSLSWSTYYRPRWAAWPVCKVTTPHFPLPPSLKTSQSLHNTKQVNTHKLVLKLGTSCPRFIVFRRKRQRSTSALSETWTPQGRLLPIPGHANMSIETLGETGTRQNGARKVQVLIELNQYNDNSKGAHYTK